MRPSKSHDASTGRYALLLFLATSCLTLLVAPLAADAQEPSAIDNAAAPESGEVYSCHGTLPGDCKGKVTDMFSRTLFLSDYRGGATQLIPRGHLRDDMALLGCDDTYLYFSDDDQRQGGMERLMQALLVAEALNATIELTYEPDPNQTQGNTRCVVKWLKRHTTP